MSLDLQLEESEEPPEIEKPAEKTNAESKSTGVLASVKNIFKNSRDPGQDDHAGSPPSYSNSRVFFIVKDFLQPDTTKSLDKTVQSILALLPEGKPGPTEFCQRAKS
ncbi:uncharacterized protein BDV17DRAFT_290816 [Aspergillus undulatus]|uniref:uncharacterized protein n=1 Tax=Aspergillus undulatus TaxID=1810928 RepID=UPI003CCDDE21